MTRTLTLNETRKQGLKPQRRDRKREDATDADESDLASADDISFSSESDSDVLFCSASETSDRDMTQMTWNKNSIRTRCVQFV